MTHAEDVGVDEEQKTLVPTPAAPLRTRPAGLPGEGRCPRGHGGQEERRARGGPRPRQRRARTPGRPGSARSAGHRRPSPHSPDPRREPARGPAASGGCTWAPHRRAAPPQPRRARPQQPSARPMVERGRGRSGPSFPAPRGSVLMGTKFSQQIPQNGGRRLLPPQPWRRWGAIPTGEARWRRPHGRQRASAPQRRPGPPPRPAAGTAGLGRLPGLGGPDREDASIGRVCPRAEWRGTAATVWRPRPGARSRPRGKPRRRFPAPRPNRDPYCGSRHSGS